MFVLLGSFPPNFHFHLEGSFRKVEIKGFQSFNEVLLAFGPLAFANISYSQQL